jgi:hypothetical protein
VQRRPWSTRAPQDLQGFAGQTHSFGMATAPHGRGSAAPNLPATGSGPERGQVQANASMSSFKDNPFLLELRAPRPSANYRRAGDSDSGFERGQGNSRAGPLGPTVVPSTRPKSSFRGSTCPTSGFV